MAHQRPSRGNHGSSEAIKRQSWLIRGHQKAIMAHQCVPRADAGKVGVALLRRKSVKEFKQVGHVRPILQEHEEGRTMVSSVAIDGSPV